MGIVSQVRTATANLMVGGVEWNDDKTIARTGSIDAAQHVAVELFGAGFVSAIELNQSLGGGVYSFAFELWLGDDSGDTLDADDEPQVDRTVTVYYFAPSMDQGQQPRWAVRDTRLLPDDSIVKVFDTPEEAEKAANGMGSDGTYEAWERPWAVTPVLHR